MAQANDAVYSGLLIAYTQMFPAGSTLELRKGDEVLAEIPLPGNPWAPVAGRHVDVSGQWASTAKGAGVVDNYRLVSASGMHEDAGTVSGSDGDGDMRMDNPSLARGQNVAVTSFRKEM